MKNLLKCGKLTDVFGYDKFQDKKQHLFFKNYSLYIPKTHYSTSEHLPEMLVNVFLCDYGPHKDLSFFE